MVVIATDSSIPALTIVISTTQGFMAIQRHLATVEVAAERVGRQVLVGDGSPHEPPGADALAHRCAGLLNHSVVGSLTLIWWLLTCQSAGQFTGYIAGPGSSRRNVI
jgi:hypothetical protein